MTVTYDLALADQLAALITPGDPDALAKACRTLDLSLNTVKLIVDRGKKGSASEETQEFSRRIRSAMAGDRRVLSVPGEGVTPALLTFPVALDEKPNDEPDDLAEEYEDDAKGIPAPPPLTVPPHRAERKYDAELVTLVGQAVRAGATLEDACTQHGVSPQRLMNAISRSHRKRKNGTDNGVATAYEQASGRAWGMRYAAAIAHREEQERPEGPDFCAMWADLRLALRGAALAGADVSVTLKFVRLVEEYYGITVEEAAP